MGVYVVGWDDGSRGSHLSELFFLFYSLVPIHIVCIFPKSFLIQP